MAFEQLYLISVRNVDSRTGSRILKALSKHFILLDIHVRGVPSA